MTHDRHAHAPEENPAEVIEAIRAQLDASTEIERILALSARLAAFGIEEPYRDWPGSISTELAVDLPSRLKALCQHVLEQLNETHGEKLGRAVVASQDLHCLHAIDRRHGGLLAPVHPAFEGVSHVCSRALLDDEAACWIEDFCHRNRCDLMAPDAVLPIMLHAVGDSGRNALVSSLSSSRSIPVVEVMPVPVFEGELVFDGGRPSQRMMRRFAERCGLIRCLDGSECEVRAALEDDWRISIEFNGRESWCQRIDRVRLGSRTALPDDERRDFWSTSLQSLGLDTQTRLVGQPILVALTNGERFSL
mgnify:CR=1 FL=1